MGMAQGSWGAPLSQAAADGTTAAAVLRVELLETWAPHPAAKLVLAGGSAESADPTMGVALEVPSRSLAGARRPRHYSPPPPLCVLAGALSSTEYATIATGA